ncbi:MAG: hypothetical protein IPM97_03885 [Bdellovibrionaceae bacterium]|nr:hypothetical protein [Pseudobdellovibrionaceae bacterium]
MNYEFAGRISRLVGDLSASEEYLRKGVALSNEFPIYQAALFLELSKTLATNNLKTTEAKDFAKRAADLYRQCEAQSVLRWPIIFEFNSLG